MRSKKFQTNTVSFRDVYKMSISDRVSLAKSSRGSNLLSSLTPEQYAALFPKFYLKNLPDIGGFQAAMTPEGKKKLQNATSGGSAAQAPYRTETQRRLATLNQLSADAARREATPPSIRRLEERTGVKISDPGAKAQLSEEKRKVLELMKKGSISSDDPRVSFVGKLSDEDRRQAGIETVKSEDGKTSFRMLPSTVDSIPREQIADDLRQSSTENFSPRERAVLDFISRREGSKDPNVIFGDHNSVGGTGRFSKALGLDKRPLTDHSIAEVLKLQSNLTRITREQGIGVVNGRALGTSAVGTGQMIRSTLISNLRALGIPESEWGNIKFDKNLQERLTLQNFKSSGIGDPNADPSTWNIRRLGVQYESLNPDRIGPKGNLRPGELDSIRNSSSDKIPSGVVDSAAIDREIERRRQQEYDDRSRRLAEKMIPDLPAGIDPKFAALYDKMTPGQKQRVHEAITKLGEGKEDPVSEGIPKFNQIFNSNPQQIETVVGNRQNRSSQIEPVPHDPNFDINQFYEQTFSEARGYVGAIRGRNVASRISYRENTFSGLCGMATTGVAGALFKDSRFSEPIGGNADSLSRNNNFLQRTGLYKDKQNTTMDQLNDSDYLDSLPIGTVVTTTGGSRGAGHAQVKVGPGKWVSDGVQGNKVLTRGYGNPAVHLPNAEALRRLNPNLVSRDPGTRNYMEREGIPFEMPTPEQVAAGIPGVVPTQEQKLKQEDDARTVAGEQAETGKTAGQVESVANTATTEQVAVATQEPIANTATPVPVLADGGTVKTDDDSITAYPISDLKGDNSLVVDSKNKPLFTMNTNKESANFDPNTGNVTVNPESVNRNNPDSLTPPKETNSREEEQTPGVTQMSRSQPPVSQSQPSDNSAMRERMIMSTVSPFTCPSFKRAISESNFKRTSSDGVGVGHFDQNNYSLK
jgi:hypothetical protein